MGPKIPKSEKLRITVYPHIRVYENSEHREVRYFQAGILVEDIPGVVDEDYIYSDDSIKRLVGILAVKKSEWANLILMLYRLFNKLLDLKESFYRDILYLER